METATPDLDEIKQVEQVTGVMVASVERAVPDEPLPGAVEASALECPKFVLPAMAIGLSYVSLV